MHPCDCPVKTEEEKVVDRLIDQILNLLLDSVLEKFGYQRYNCYLLAKIYYKHFNDGKNKIQLQNVCEFVKAINAGEIIVNNHRVYFGITFLENFLGGEESWTKS
jgi:hypothetical protein